MKLMFEMGADVATGWRDISGKREKSNRRVGGYMGIRPNRVGNIRLGVWCGSVERLNLFSGMGARAARTQALVFF